MTLFVICAVMVAMAVLGSAFYGRAPVPIRPDQLQEHQAHGPDDTAVAELS